jgi:hypothetical protein
MHPLTRIQTSWVIGGLLLFGALVEAKPAFGQKFARARSLEADSGDTADDSSLTQAPATRNVPTRKMARPRTMAPNNGTAPQSVSPFSYAYPGTPPKVHVPGWQTTNGFSGKPRGRVIRHVPGQPIDPQEGDIIYEEPDFGGARIVSPGRTRTMRQGGGMGAAELIGPGQPTPAPGSRPYVQSEGVESPVIDGGTVVDGTVVEGDDGEPVYDGDGSGPGCGCGGFGLGCGGFHLKNSEWGPCYYDDSDDHCAVPCDGWCIPRRCIEETALFLGVQGFTGPMDLGGNGNFGYHEGVNFAGHFGSWFGLGALGLGYQIGATFLQSDLNGNMVNGVQAKERDQQFLTAGLFRRAHDGYGLQGGFVYDYMHDNYYAKYSVGQIRSELSYLTLFGHEFGYWGAYSVHDGNGMINGTFAGFQTLDMYNGFYRYTFSNGTQGRIWVGGTGTKQGIIGSDFRIPLSNRWDLWGWYNYIIPGHAGAVGTMNQGWNLTINVVWYPGRRAVGIHQTPFRALFAPADNNWLISRQSK